MRVRMACVLAFTALAVAGVLGGAEFAFAYGGTGSIAGNVTNQVTHAPVAGIRVMALYDYGGGWSFDDIQFTDPSGNYTLVNLQPFPMRIEFADPNDEYFTEYWNDQTEWDQGDLVPVGEGTYTPNINAELLPGAFIEGSVVESSTGDPIPNIWIEPVYWDGLRWQNACVPVISQADGTYRVGPLHAGSYPVRFRDDTGIYYTQYYDRVGTVDEALQVGVTAGSLVTGVNARLSEGLAISGTVRDENTGDSIGGADVAVWRLFYGYLWQEVAGVTTASDGTYYAGRLEDGQYLVSFSDLSHGRYLG
ncbi:MAG: hypothetical protein Q8K99_09340, partial [Actinomycetota bacterium]|nr:hypothetical protein [Actinomycetota bacterium]